MERVSHSDNQHIDYNINCKMININCTNTKGSNYIIKSWKTKNTDASQQNNVQINFNLTNSIKNHKSESKSYNNYFNYTQHHRQITNYSTQIKQKLNNSEVPKKNCSLFYGCSVCSIKKSQKSKTIDDINWQEYTNSLEEIHLPYKSCNFRNKITKQENTKRSENQTYFNRIIKCSENQYNFIHSLNKNTEKVNETTHQFEDVNTNLSIVKPKYVSIKMDDELFRILRSLKEKVDCIITTSLNEAFLLQYIILNTTINLVKRIKRNVSKMKSLITVIYLYSKNTCKQISNNDLFNKNIHMALTYFKRLLTKKRIKYFAPTNSGNHITNHSTSFNHNADSLMLIANELKEIKEILKSCKLNFDDGHINNKIISPKVYPMYAKTTTPLPPPPPPPLPPLNIFQNKKLNHEKNVKDTFQQRPVITVEALKSVQLRKVTKLRTGINEGNKIFNHR